jgi:hypothetical protein
MSDIVAFPLFPGEEDYSHAECSMTAWKNWCVKHGVKFVLVSYPTIANNDTWHTTLAERLHQRYGKETRIFLAESDTLIHWDCVSPFDMIPQSLNEGVRVGDSIDFAIKILKERGVTRFFDRSLMISVWEKISHYYL